MFVDIKRVRTSHSPSSVVLFSVENNYKKLEVRILEQALR